VATYGLYIVIALLAIVLFLAVIGPVIHSLMNFKTGWKGWASLIGFAILGFVAYTVGKGNTTLNEYGMVKEGLSLGQLNIINGVLYLFFILLAVTVILFLISIVKDIISGFVK